MDEIYLEEDVMSDWGRKVIFFVLRLRFLKDEVVPSIICVVPKFYHWSMPNFRRCNQLSLIQGCFLKLCASSVASVNGF